MIFVILCVVFSFFAFNRTSAIPMEWNSSLSLTYSTQGRYYEFYNFKGDTLYMEKGYGEKKVKSSIKIEKQQLENLLMTLRNNEAEKIRTEDVKDQKDDAVSFLLSLKVNDNYIFNLSSAGGRWGKEIRKKDLNRYNAIVEHILKISKIKA